MAGKEEKFFEKFCASCQRGEAMGDGLEQMAKDGAPADAALKEMRKLAEAEEAALPALYDKMGRAFSGRTDAETARFLLGQWSDVTDEALVLAERLAGGDGAALSVMAELVRYALRDLARMTAYDRSAAEDRMKAEARFLRIQNYERRGADFFLETVRRANGEAYDGTALWQMELAEHFRRMLRRVARCAAQYLFLIGASR